MAQISLTEWMVKFVGSLILLLSAYLLSSNISSSNSSIWTGVNERNTDYGAGVLPNLTKLPNFSSLSDDLKKIEQYQDAAREVMEAEIQRARTVFARLNKPIPVRLYQEAQYTHATHPSQQRYNVTSHASTRMAIRPNVHPRGETVHELSLFITRAEMDSTTHDAILYCISAATNTTKHQWGLFNAEQFTPEQTQLEYFVSLPSGDHPSFDKFIHGGRLENCVRNRTTGGKFGLDGKIHYARRIVRARSVHDGFIGEEPWVIGGIIVMMTTVFVEFMVLFRLRARKRNLKAVRAGIRARTGNRNAQDSIRDVRRSVFTNVSVVSAQSL